MYHKTKLYYTWMRALLSLCPWHQYCQFKKNAFRDTTQRFVYLYKDYPCFFYLHPSPFNVFFFSTYLPDVHGAYVSLFRQQLAFFSPLFYSVFFLEKKNSKKPSHFFSAMWETERTLRSACTHVSSSQMTFLYFINETQIPRRLAEDT